MADPEQQAQATARVPAELTYSVKRESNLAATVIGGAVIPHQMVTILAQMPGEVESIAGEEGTSLRQGEPLVVQDTAALMAKREAALAGLNSAQAGLGNAQVQYQREQRTPNSMSNSMLGGLPSMISVFTDPVRSVAGEGSPGYERYSSLYGQSVQVQTAQNQIDMALAGIRELDENILNATNRAPFNGTIMKKMVQVGDVVQPGMPLVVFADTSRMQIQVEVPTRLLRQFKEGNKVMARLDSEEELVEATVAKVFPMAAMGGHTTTVKVDLPADTLAKAGMYAEILVQDSKNATAPPLSIPTSAISWRGSLPSVFLVVEDGTRLKMRSVRLGAKNNNIQAVLTGLKEGDVIMRHAGASMRSGPYQPAAE